MIQGYSTVINNIFLLVDIIQKFSELCGEFMTELDAMSFLFGLAMGVVVTLFIVLVPNEME